MEPKRNELKGIWMLMLTAFIWGTAFVAQSVGMDYVGPFTFNGVRYIIGGMVLIPCISFLDSRKAEKTQQDRKALLIGGLICGTVLFAACITQQFGILYTTVGKSGFISAMYIVIVPLMGIFLKKKIGLKIGISVAIAVAGLYLLCITEDFSVNKGDTLSLICAFLFAVHILVIDHFSHRLDSVRLSCAQFFVVGFISLICAFIFETPDIAHILSAWKPILYTGILSSGVAYTLQTVAQKHVNPTMASLVMSLESVFAVLAGWIILKQTLTNREIIGCVLMFAAILLSQLPEKMKKSV